MEIGKTDAVDEASGLLSACSQRGECLIYTAQGDIIGRCVFMLHEIRACCTRGTFVHKRVRRDCVSTQQVCSA